MKISQDIRLGIEKTAREQKSAATGSANFSAMVKKNREKLQIDEFHHLLSQIDDAGNKLARSRNFKDLSKYKTLVKQFIRQAVDYNMNMKQSQSWNQYGDSHRLNIVETVDKKLADLTDEYMKKERPVLDILGKIGEIKGLLINLYT
ncbi:YaaR family protein [Heyndrickxia acidiproducens]|uniref:YaaR family protein n=1 Tax=Heyndrickxia acidiproducens TaxID=1121084 RepID=UPI00037A7ADC|nr:YaaR family protein [Heyndrickxia acidiproducens]